MHTWTGTPTETEIAAMEDRMRLYIAPNEVRTEEQQEAFDKAVRYQIAHEKSQASGNVPAGVNSFRIGDFQMAFGDGANDASLNERNLCPSAKYVLWNAELLYRGLEGRCFGCR